MSEGIAIAVRISSTVRETANSTMLKPPMRLRRVRGFGGLLGEGRFVEDIAGKAWIEFTGVVEDLNGAASVVFPGDLKRGPDAVFQLVVRVDRDIFVDLLGFFVLGNDGAANQEMSGTINGQAELAFLAVGDLDPIHLLEVDRVVAAEADVQARLLEAQPQQIVDVALDLFLEIADGGGRHFADAAPIESPAVISVL